MRFGNGLYSIRVRVLALQYKKGLFLLCNNNRRNKPEDECKGAEKVLLHRMNHFFFQIWKSEKLTEASFSE